MNACRCCSALMNPGAAIGTPSLRGRRGTGLVWLLLVAGLFWIPGRAAQAAGREFSMQANDLSVTIDSRWAGGATGGYYPLRIRVTNLAGKRAITLRCVSNSSDQLSLPTVEKSVILDPNATQQVTLSVPLVGVQSNLSFQIIERGERLNAFNNSVSISDAQEYGLQRPSLLVVSPVNVDCDRFEDAVNSMVMRLSGGGGGRYGGSFRGADHEVIPPQALPENWIDYTALDILAISRSTLEALTPTHRTALLQWSETGGTLIVFDVGAEPQKSEPLHKLLNRADNPEFIKGWTAADLSRRTPIQYVSPDGTMSGSVPGAIVGTVPVVPSSSSPEAAVNVPVWDASGSAFAMQSYGLGRVFAFSGNPFPGSAMDWNWLLETMGQSGWKWSARMGNAPRMWHPEFFQFLIPGVGAAPVYAFLVLITGFSLIIGPVNLWILSRRRQMYLLVVTIPAISLLTCISLFLYAIIADGFGIQSRVRSLTLLDQSQKTAIEMNRIALYAGLSPSSGLKFSPQTAIFPVWSDDEGLRGGVVNWTETQHLTRGWLPARTITQFVTNVHRPERGRLEVQTPKGDKLTVSNGLSRGLKQLVVKADDGKLYSGQNIPAGAQAELQLLQTSDQVDLVQLLDTSPLQFPDGFSGGSPFDTAVRMRRYGYSAAQEVGRESSFNSSLMEQQIQQFRQLQSGNPPSRTYYGVFDSNPGIELGISGSSEQNSLFLVIGKY